MILIYSSDRCAHRHVTTRAAPDTVAVMLRVVSLTKNVKHFPLLHKTRQIRPDWEHPGLNDLQPCLAAWSWSQSYLRSLSSSVTHIYQGSHSTSPHSQSVLWLCSQPYRSGKGGVHKAIVLLFCFSGIAPGVPHGQIYLLKAAKAPHK